MDLIVTASASNRVIVLASQARRGRGRVCTGHVRSRSAGGSAKGPGLVNDDDSARALWRDPHEHRVRVGVSAEVTQEDIALRDGRRDEQIIVEGLCGPCSYLRE